MIFSFLRKAALCLGFCAIVALPAAVVAPGHSYAVDIIDPVCQNIKDKANVPAYCSDKGNTDNNPLTGPDGLLTKIISITSIMVGVAAVIGAIISGMRMVVSGGDANAVTTARTALIYCVVAVVVALAAQALVAFVISKI
jgi:hypothetical protein